MDDKKKRTLKVIEYFKGLPEEFSMLKGLLCYTYGLPAGEDSIFDNIMIAERMDVVNIK